MGRVGRRCARATKQKEKERIQRNAQQEAHVGSGARHPVTADCWPVGTRCSGMQANAL